MRPQLAFRGEGEGRRERHAASRLGEDPGLFRQQPDPGHDLGIGDRGRPAAGLDDGTFGKTTISGISNGDRPRNRLWDDGHDLVGVLTHESHDRRAPCRLRPTDAGRRTGDQPGVPEFFKPLAQLGHERSTRHRGDYGSRQPPTQLLGNLERERFGSFAVIAAQVDVHDAPAE